MALTRIPLTIVATAGGKRTDGVLVAVMAEQLDALEGDLKSLTEGVLELFRALDHRAETGSAEMYFQARHDLTMALGDAADGLVLTETAEVTVDA